MSSHLPKPPTTGAPYLPSHVECRCYLYGLPSGARMIARSSTDVWMLPSGPEAYLQPKAFDVFGAHPLNGIWEDVVGPAIADYLAVQHVRCSIIHPVRLGVVGETPDPFPAFIILGVDHETLSPEAGLQVAVHCRSILVEHDIDDVHVIVYESKYQSHAGLLFRPALTYNPIAGVREPFSTTLGIPICNAATPNCEGTGGLFFVDKAMPGKLFLLTARHVLLHPDEFPNTHYMFEEGAGSTKHSVLLMGEAIYETRSADIKTAIKNKTTILEHLRSRLEHAFSLDEEDATNERNDVLPSITATEKAIVALKEFSHTVKAWADPTDRVIGHIVLSPPLVYDHEDGGFTQDFAVVEIDDVAKINRANFVGNAMDLGSVPFEQLVLWMMRPRAQAGQVSDPASSSSSSFEYPGNRLLRFCDKVSDEEMTSPNLNGGDPGITVLKSGGTTKLTVGRLNTIRAFTRNSSGQDRMSKELAVLPRTTPYSDAFSAQGDSGSVVVDGKGRVYGMLTGGAGGSSDGTSPTEAARGRGCDSAFVTSIDFLLRRLKEHGFDPNIFPKREDLPV